MTFYTAIGAVRRPARAALAALALGVLGACDLDEVLNVPDPDVATPESVQDVTALPAVRAGAIGDLALAVTGSGGNENGLVQYTGLFTDELIWAETFPTRGQIDRREIEVINGTMEGLFQIAQRARASAERAADAYVRLDPSNAARAEMHALAGFSYVFIAEAYCSGVPFSQLVDGVATFSAGLTTVQMFERAIVLFDSALTAPGVTATFTNLAKVGKGRALLNLARYADADAAVDGVPTSFVYSFEYSENSARQNNGVFVVTHLNRRFSAATGEGQNGLPYYTEGDPRVTATLTATPAFDNSTPLYLQQKFTSRTASFPLATGTEARLIEAEAQLNAGNAVGALGTLNALRAGTTGLSPLTLQLTADGQENQLFKERAYWLWLTAHRLGDLRRLIRQYGRTEDEVFPTGEFFKSGNYGDDVNFPIPFSEQNNPEYSAAGAACIDRNA